MFGLVIFNCIFEIISHTMKFPAAPSSLSHGDKNISLGNALASSYLFVYHIRSFIWKFAHLPIQQAYLESFQNRVILVNKIINLRSKWYKVDLPPTFTGTMYFRGCRNLNFLIPDQLWPNWPCNPDSEISSYSIINAPCFNVALFLKLSNPLAP